MYIITLRCIPDMVNTILNIYRALRVEIRNRMLRRHSFQKEHWREHLENYNQEETGLPYGYEWGNLDDPQDRFGNYQTVKQLLMDEINPDYTVLEIGALGGKWTQFILHAKKVIAVDINDYFKDYLIKRFPEQENLEFYVSRGNELKGIVDNSVDFVFSMDTFTRVKEKYIWDYFKEISRVLGNNGTAVLHLPNNDLPVSLSRGFTPLNTKKIQKYAGKYFRNFIIDSETLAHGSLLIAKK